jgi:hypothetical protein
MRFFTCSFSTKCSFNTCSMGMWPISIGRDRIKGSDNRFLNCLVNLFHQIMIVATSSPARSWVDCITTTVKEREVWKTR